MALSDSEARSGIEAALQGYAASQADGTLVSNWVVAAEYALADGRNGSVIITPSGDTGASHFGMLQVAAQRVLEDLTSCSCGEDEEDE